MTNILTGGRFKEPTRFKRDIDYGYTTLAVLPADINQRQAQREPFLEKGRHWAVVYHDSEHPEAHFYDTKSEAVDTARRERGPSMGSKNPFLAVMDTSGNVDVTFDKRYRRLHLMEQGGRWVLKPDQNLFDPRKYGTKAEAVQEAKAYAVEYGYDKLAIKPKGSSTKTWTNRYLQPIPEFPSRWIRGQ